MNKREAKRLGHDTGYFVAETNLREKDHPKDCEEFFQEALEAEQNGRQFSPFEFTANEFNDSRDPDGMWEAYENGVVAGVRARLRKAGCKGGDTGTLAGCCFGRRRRRW